MHIIAGKVDTDHDSLKEELEVGTMTPLEAPCGTFLDPARRVSPLD